MTSLPDKLSQRIRIRLKRLQNNRRVYQIARQVSLGSPLAKLPKSSSRQAIPNPVAFFNASTRLTGISLNAAFSLLASLGLQMAGVPVVRFACYAGMSRCVLGTDRTDLTRDPPCTPCIAQSRWLFSDALVIPFTYHPDQSLADGISRLGLDDLVRFEYKLLPGSTPVELFSPLPLGQLVLPSIRWVLRRHTLVDDEPTRSLYRHYILSAGSIARQFSAFLDKTVPQAVVLFNGQFFPEAVARWVSIQRHLRTITHEVGLQAFSAFFTQGEATAYPLHVPPDFKLDETQDRRLDEYLGQRFKGQFSMAGIRFWPGMSGLDESFLQKAAAFKQVVPVFTNVIFDTSQPHSNTVFPHMFAWLDLMLEIVRHHPETLFVLRAHPDEARPGKASLESVGQWVTQNHAADIPNLVFVDTGQPLSSYDLIQRSKFVMVYNSTVGLEASILGLPVLCAGRARFTQLPTVFFPSTPREYRQLADSFLESQEIHVPPEFMRNARRFLYYQLYRSSLPFSDFLQEDGIWPGFVSLKQFHPVALSPQTSPAIRAIVKGLLENSDFLLESDL